MQQLHRACTNQPRWRDTEQSPAVKRSRVVFLHISKETSRACVSAVGEHTALNLNSQRLVGWKRYSRTHSQPKSLSTSLQNKSFATALCFVLPFRVIFFVFCVCRIFFLFLYSLSSEQLSCAYCAYCAYCAVWHCVPTNIPNDWYYQSLGMCNVG